MKTATNFDRILKLVTANPEAAGLFSPRAQALSATQYKQLCTAAREALAKRHAAERKNFKELKAIFRASPGLKEWLGPGYRAVAARIKAQKAAKTY